ncbi:hypothetical protein GCM10012275_52870 [Longimycelium tulufanense]|uniref:Uncharacterized protein n=1 Tax=Longimycelium tulufanense TaxID=907463 RepID=A0A8J3CIZ3_9PSEU|nr:hypothetical protein GCM10012275_52870 [Longimycelium tulufanense]
MGPPPEWPLGSDIVTQARLQVAREQLVEAEDQAQVGKATRLRERVAVLEHVVAIQAEAECALWVELWGTPQAVAWEWLRWIREVAQYVRHKVLAENGDLDHAREARQQADRLGLTPLALLRLRWEIVEDAVSPTSGRAGGGSVTPIDSRRARLLG